MENFQTNGLRNDFKAGLANEGYELRKALSQNNILDKNILQNCKNIAGDHIKAMCLAYAAKAGKSVSNVPCDIKIAGSGSIFAKLAGSVIGGISGYELSTMSIRTIDHWFKSDEHLSFSEIIAELLDIDTDVVTVVATLATAIVGAVAASKLSDNIFKEKVIEDVMKDYEQNTVPKLMEWFDREIGGRRKLEWNE